ncbi:MAG: phenylacetic acid degradation protein, partial [Deltaproteobacteria bacterium]
MPRPPSLPQFDTTIAETFVRASATVTGLPGYLGVRFVEMTAGRLVA